MKTDIFHAYQALLRQTKPSSNVNINQDPNSMDEMGMTALHIAEYFEEEDGRLCEETEEQTNNMKNMAKKDKERLNEEERDWEVSLEKVKNKELNFEPNGNTTPGKHGMEATVLGIYATKWAPNTPLRTFAILTLVLLHPLINTEHRARGGWFHINNKLVPEIEKYFEDCSDEGESTGEDHVDEDDFSGIEEHCDNDCDNQWTSSYSDHQTPCSDAMTCSRVRDHLTRMNNTRDQGFVAIS